VATTTLTRRLGHRRAARERHVFRNSASPTKQPPADNRLSGRTTVHTDRRFRDPCMGLLTMVRPSSIARRNPALRKFWLSGAPDTFRQTTLVGDGRRSCCLPVTKRRTSSDRHLVAVEVLTWCPFTGTTSGRPRRGEFPPAVGGGA